MFAAINIRDGLGPAACRVERKTAGVAEDVQHFGAVAQWPHGLPVLSLVEKESGLLTVDDVGGEADSVFNKLNRLAPFVADQPPPRSATLLASFNNRRHTGVLHQPGGNFVDVPKRTGGRAVELDHRDIGISVTDQTGQTVSLAVEQAIAGRRLVKQPLPQRPGLRTARFGPFVVQPKRFLNAARAKRDTAAGIIETDRDRPAAGVVQKDGWSPRLGGRQVTQGIGEHPRVPAFHAASEITSQPKSQSRRLAAEE